MHARGEDGALRTIRPAWRILIYLILCALAVPLTGRIMAVFGFSDPFLPLFLGLTAVTWGQMRFLEGGGLSGLGLRWTAATPLDLGLGLLLPPLLLGAIFLLEWSVHWLLLVRATPIAAGLVAASCWRFGVIAWYEELFARGYLLQRLMLTTRAGLANALTALAFAGLHLFNPGFSPAAMIGIFLAGLLLGLCYQTTRSLYLPMAFHFAWNLWQAWLGFPVSGTAQAGFFRVVRAGPILITGGPFGPEAGLVGFLAILVSLGLVLYYGKIRTRRSN